MTLAETLLQVIPDFPEALCRGTYDKFHPESTATPAQIKELKSICSQCPELLKCRKYALDQKIPGGFWGGLSEEERRSVIRREGGGDKKGATAVPSKNRLGEVVKRTKLGQSRTRIARELGISFIQVDRVCQLAKKQGLI